MIAPLDKDRPVPTRDVDLRGLDYLDRRGVLFEALHALAPGEVLHVLSDRAAELVWLRLEGEMRCARRFSWTLPEPAGPDGFSRVTVRCIPDPTGPAR